MRRLVTCHHLSCVGEDGGGKEAKGVDTCIKNRRRKEEEMKGGGDKCGNYEYGNQSVRSC